MIRFDVIIGSGLGGAVLSCRFSERGSRALVLKRGHRSPPEDTWIWGKNEPESQKGWMNLRFLKNIGIAQGAGGGLPIYAHVSIGAKPAAFKPSWPSAITYCASPEEISLGPARRSCKTTRRRPVP